MTKNVAVASAVKQKITQNSVEILVFFETSYKLHIFRFASRQKVRYNKSVRK